MTGEWLKQPLRGETLWERLAPFAPSCCGRTLLHALVTSIDRETSACVVVKNMMLPNEHCCDFQRVWRGYLHVYSGCVAALSTTAITTGQERLLWLLNHGALILRLLAQTEGLLVSPYSALLSSSSTVEPHLDAASLTALSRCVMDTFAGQGDHDSVDDAVANVLNSSPTCRQMEVTPTTTYVSVAALPLLQWLVVDLLACDLLHLKLTALVALREWSCHVPPPLLLVHVAPALLTALAEACDVRTNVAVAQCVLDLVKACETCLTPALMELVFLHILPSLVSRCPPPLWATAVECVWHLFQRAKALPASYDVQQHFIAEVMRPAVDSWWSQARTKGRPAFLRLTPWLVRIFDAKEVKRTLTPMWFLCLNDKDAAVRAAVSEFLWFKTDVPGEASAKVLDVGEQELRHADRIRHTPYGGRGARACPDP